MSTLRLLCYAAVAVLAAECASYHAMRAAAGEWWLMGDASRKGVRTWLVDFFVNTVLWLLCHACAGFWSVRNPIWIGPHVMAWTIMCSLLEGAVVVCSILFWHTSSSTPVSGNSSHSASGDTPDEAEKAHMMVRSINLVALCTALLSLVLFLWSVEKPFRRTFYARDPRCALHRRQWDEAEGRPTGDEDRSTWACDSELRYVGDLASAWIVKGAPGWALQRPAWYTEGWRERVRAKAHLMGETGAAAALAAMAEAGDAQGNKPAGSSMGPLAV